MAVTLADGMMQVLEGDHIVIATGSRPAVQPVDGLPPQRILTNENVVDLPDAPAHLAIIGAGPIALELAFAFRI
ncbi:MAG: hypothetical protein NVS4B8_30430 [Herpetosiphon sp.]